MSSPPQTKSFAAWINLMPGTSSKLFVTGEVETSASNKVPVLTPSDTPISAKNLALDLGIRATGGIGTQAFGFRPVRYESPSSQDEFHTVTIHWAGEEILTLNVDEAH